jgi:hypothetical protein
LRGLTCDREAVRIAGGTLLAGEVIHRHRIFEQ